jgi:hypothetical protein
MPDLRRDAQIEALNEQVRRRVHPVTGNQSDLDPLLEMIGDARYVLIGEASHGTHEFHAPRALEPMERTCQWEAGEVPRRIRHRSEPRAASCHVG